MNLFQFSMLSLPVVGLVLPFARPVAMVFDSWLNFDKLDDS